MSTVSVDRQIYFRTTVENDSYDCARGNSKKEAYKPCKLGTWYKFIDLKEDSP